MEKNPQHPWDGPADGDFASYVERLSGAPAQHPEPLPHLDNGSHNAAVASAASVAPPRLATGPEDGSNVPASSFAGVVRTARAVVLLLVIAQALALFYFQVGVVPLLLFTGVLWFSLGRLQRVLSKALPVASRPDSASLQRLREQLQRAARERHNTPKQ